MTLSTIGWLGSILFSICGFPQAYECYRQGHAKGLNSAFLACWALGEILTLIYVLGLEKFHWPLIANYCVNLASLIIIYRYKFFPRAS